MKRRTSLIEANMPVLAQRPARTVPVVHERHAQWWACSPLSPRRAPHSLIHESSRSSIRLSSPRHALWKVKYTSLMYTFRKQLSVGAFVEVRN